MSEELKRVPCYMCSQNCGLLLHVKDGVLVGAVGDPDSIIGGGYTCERVNAILEFHYSEKRLNYPLKRAGNRGEGKWERIGWNQAMDEIAEKMVKIKDEFGTEAVQIFGGAMHEPGDWASTRFANYWGTPNIYQQGKNVLYEVAMTGWQSLDSIPIPGVTKNIVAWGVNPPQSWSAKWNTCLEAMKKGARLVCIDPRYTETAARADLWLQIKPGTDGALGWGVINYIIDNGLYDKEFVENWCLDFEKVAEKAKEYPLEKVSKITGLPEWKIIKFADLHCGSPCCQLIGAGTYHMGGEAAQSAAHAMVIIRAITGNVDHLGGNSMTGPHKFLDYFEVMGYNYLMQNKEIKDCVTADKYPLSSIASLKRINAGIKRTWSGEGFGALHCFLSPSSKGIVDAIIDGTPYPIKALFIQGGNPLLTVTGGKSWYEAMKKLDLAVGMDFFMTPSMALCDYVLPAASFLERDHMMLWRGLTNITGAWKQAMPALYERKDDYYIWKELAHRLNVPGQWPNTIADMYTLFLTKKTGLTHSELAAREYNYNMLVPKDAEPERYKKHGFGTPSGKLELVPSLLATAGIDPMPHYVPGPQDETRTPELAKEYPYRLISGTRIRPYWHTSFRQLKSLRWMHEYPEVEIHPEIARQHNIANGEWIYIETTAGRIRQKARITTEIRSDTINAEGYWYYPEIPEEDPYLLGVWDSNINAIIPDDYEMYDYIGENPFNGSLCKIYKVDTTEYNPVIKQIASQVTQRKKKIEVDAQCIRCENNCSIKMIVSDQDIVTEYWRMVPIRHTIQRKPCKNSKTIIGRKLPEAKKLIRNQKYKKRSIIGGH